MNDEELVTVYNAPNAAAAEIIAADLDSEGIVARVSDENQGGFTGVNVMAVEVMVMAHDAERARKIIAEHDKSHADDAEETEEVEKA